jgi:hypothetical protein
MTQATTPSEGSTDTVMTLLDAPTADSESVTVVVVARPGDSVEHGLPAVVDAAGELSREWARVTVDDGVAVTEVGGPRLMMSPATDVRVSAGSGRRLDVTSERSARLGPEWIPQSFPADPRALMSESDKTRLRSLTGDYLAGYGVASSQVDATLLATGPLGGSPADYGELVGATFPSGATAAWIVTSSSQRPEAASLWELPFAPAGTALLDRVLAVRVLGGLMVSAPSGVSAEAVDAGGTVLATVPLRAGAGAGPLVNAGGATRVRILDATGGVVAEAPITEPNR